MENYEQKYKQALDAFRKFKDAYKTTDHSVTYKEMKELFANIEASFPELAESEDERIKKELIDFFSDSPDSDTFRGIPPSKVIAWLEKQGEQKPVFGMKTPEESLGIDSETYNKIVDDCVYGEQKPAWSEEDDNCLSTIIAEFSKCAGKSVSKDEWMRCNDFLNSLKDRVQPQPKQEWGEEDEQYLLVCKNALAKYQTTDKWDADIISYWLENKLKSLRPQNTWKPSDEQLDALEDAIRYGEEELIGILSLLYNDLKKLKDEK